MALASPSLAYYQAIRTSEYRLAPNFLAWLTAPLTLLADASTCVESLTAAFDLDSASGGQLDILGQIVGQVRTVGFQPSGGVSPVLDDATYRLLLKSRIAQNAWQGTIDELQAIWGSLFPGGQIVITDSQNMTATILLSGAFSSIVQDLIMHGYIVPRPEGVLYNYTFSTLPVFGTDQDNAFIAGFDHGHFT